MVETSAVIVAVLLGGIALFQLALASGAPWGDHAFGGRAPTNRGRLPMTYRAMSGVAIPVLLIAGWVVLERAGVTPGDGEPTGWVRGATWVLVVYLVVNTATNLTSSSKIERLVMGSITAVAATGTLIVAIGS